MRQTRLNDFSFQVFVLRLINQARVRSYIFFFNLGVVCNAMSFVLFLCILQNYILCLVFCCLSHFFKCLKHIRCRSCAYVTFTILFQMTMTTTNDRRETFNSKQQSSVPHWIAFYFLLTITNTKHKSHTQTHTHTNIHVLIFFCIFSLMTFIC